MKLKDISEALKDEPKYRNRQALHEIYCRLIPSWAAAKSLPRILREKLQSRAPIDIMAAETTEAHDKVTVKAALDFGDAVIETVLMRHADGRNTVCVSSQAGCALGCEFCATGKLGLKRNLTADEIEAQALYFARYLKRVNEQVTNVVFMGMGEPLLNYDNVLTAIRHLNDKDLLNIGARKISISTAGYIPGIRKLEKEKLQINLALSLHAPDDALRSRLMPINDKYPLKRLLSATAGYIAKSNRRVMIEYLLMAGINDSPKQAQMLSDLLRKNLNKLFFVNLIKYNETGVFAAPSSESIGKFGHVLEKNGIEVVNRYRFGYDIKGACGQLVGKKFKI